MSGYLKDIALRKQLEEKVREATRVRTDADKALTAATDLVGAARRIDAVTTDADTLVAEATAAMSGKDYKLALDKAVAAKEKATRIYRERAKGIVDASVNLVAIAKGVGSDVSESEASMGRAREALGAEDFETAIDLAKKAWKRLEKVLHEHLSGSFSKAQSLIIAAKNLGRDTGTVEDLLSRARSAMESNDFEMAMGFTKECLDTVTGELRSELERTVADTEALMRTAREMGADVAKMAQLIERGRQDMERLDFEKAFNAFKQSRAEGERALQKGLDGKVTDFTQWVARAEKLGADTTGARVTLRQAEQAIKEGRFQDGATLARQGFQTLQQVQFQRVLSLMNQSRDKFVAAKNLGADLSGPVALLQQARGGLQQGDFEAAVEAARKADAEVDRIVSEFRNMEGSVRELARMGAEAETLGVAVAGARRHLERAREALQAKDFAGSRESVKKGREELERAEYDRTMEIVEKTEFILTSGERLGADLAESSKALEDAILATKEKEYRRAIDLAIKSRDLAEGALQKRLETGLTGLRASLQFLGEDATAVKSLIAKAESAVAAKDVDGAFGFLAEGQKVSESKTKDRASQYHETVRAAVTLMQDLGGESAGFEAILKDMNAAMGDGRYADVVGLRERASKDLAAASENLFNLVKQKVVQAKNMRINIDEMRELLKRSKMSLGVEDTVEALRMLKETNDKANKVLELYRTTHNAISSAAALVAEAKKRDVDVTKVLEMLLESKKAFERLDFERALELANRSKAETEKLMILYTSAQRLISSREKLDVAGRLGIDTPELRDLLNNAKESMKSKEYERALQLSERAEKGLTELIGDKIASVATTAEGVLADIEGVEFSAVQSKIIQARNLAAAQQYAQATDLVLQIRDEVEKLKKVGEQSAVAMKRARDAIAEVETMNIDPTSARRLLEKADRSYKSGRFDEALDLANKAAGELETETQQAVAGTMKRFEDSIEKARREGIDTRSADKLFERAKEFLRERKFRQALAVAMQSESETERVALQQDMAAKAIQTIEKRLAGFGHPIAQVASIVDEAKAAFKSGDYVKALDLAIRGGDEFGKRREITEDALEARTGASRIVEVLKAIGADPAKVAKVHRDAEAAFARGDSDGARNLYQQALDWGVGAARTHLLEKLHKARATAELGQRLDVDVAGSLKRFSEAKAQIESENFEDAYELMEAGIKDAQSGIAAQVSDALTNAESTVQHAKRIGADVGDAEEQLQLASQALLEGEFERALNLIHQGSERVESRRMVEKRFVELTYKAESTIRNAKKFGIDVKEAERTLQASIALKKTDMTRAIATAEDAYRLAWEGVEGFAPSMQGSLEVEAPRLDQWSDATLVLRNTGKALAKDVQVRILGDAEVQGLKDLAAIRAKGEERVPLKIRMTAPGVIPLVIQVASHRVMDDKEYTQEMIAQIEVLAAAARVEEPVRPLVAEYESRCPICKGQIKKGFTIAKCSCGRDFHEMCAERVGRCPVCFRPIETADKKRKLKFDVG
ncbi:MAG: hypothetical protein E6K10_08630 [Methanobacteriota archaeon]|nr:MAG: hypothetical protein E6K10_08630 [Euryarchaeota archaeon]